MQDPKIMQLIGQNPQAPMLMAAGQAHLAEHVAFAYRNRMEQAMGTALPDPNDDTQVPPQMEYQLSGVLALAASKVLQQSQSEAATQAAQQAAQDPVLLMQQKELELKQAQLDLDKQIKTGQLELAKQTQADTVQLRQQEIGVKKDIAHSTDTTKQLVVGAQLAAEAEHKVQDRHHEAVMSGAQMAADAHHKGEDRSLQAFQAANKPPPAPAAKPKKGAK
jgi:stress response protein YsnF